MAEDIPEAQRRVTPSAPTRSPLPLLIGLTVLLGAAVGLGIGLSREGPSSTTPTVTPTSTPPPTAGRTDTRFGHLPYGEAPASDLQAITADGRVQLRRAAAQEFLQMQADAGQAGVYLVPLSGFRSIAYQEQVFFGIKAQRNQSPDERAKVSAPPGYSEHHTGYALDIGDGNQPSTHLDVQFAETAAFRWLQANAARYHFELSFPPNNVQGIAYEPWHWRYVGNSHSLETFYRARQLPTPSVAP
ncbi:MAG: D-alanyl-D-alanine carboxypeptidase family protein [Gloeomargaritaceae cyanobacterium C42_A2020_066]|nr:D-alanyl-D-alanine carboxypeptidase family protein [Gloeomargaritaceae cyanobacterium C42_A2020_066]